MNETFALLNKATEAFDDALLLIEHSRNEAAANRLYYSIYYLIQALLLLKSESPKTHKGLHSKFHELYIKTEILNREIGENVQDIFTLRQEGDYELEPITEKEVLEAKRKTEIVIAAIKGHLLNQIGY